MEEQVYEKSIFEEEINVVYASFWERLGAAILDWLILLPLYIINVYNSSHWKISGVMIIVGLLTLAYKPVFEYLNSATPGKKAVGITITDKDYGRPHLQNILLRNSFHIGLGLVSMIGTILIYGGVPQPGTQRFNGTLSSIPKETISSFMLSGCVSLVYLADLIVFLIDKRNRFLHDMIGKTFVIKKNK